MRDDRQLFWTNEANWPRDFAGNVFLARAVQMVGRALFGDEWTGKEPATTDERFGVWWKFGDKEGAWEEERVKPYQRDMIRDLLARCEPPIFIPEAVQMTGIGRSSLYTLFRDGKIQLRKSGKRSLVLVEDLERYVKSLPTAA